MVEVQDLEVLKELPGYKAILRALIKSQMQHLVEQLATHTEEQCVLLSASLSEGSLSHLGSEYGKEFLENYDDLKKQFLGFCLKKQLKSKTTTTEAGPNIDRQSSFAPPSTFSQADSHPKRPRPSPVMPVRQRPSTSPYSRFRPPKQTPTRPTFSTPTSTVTSNQEQTTLHEGGNQSTFGIKEEQTDIPGVNQSLNVFNEANASLDQLESNNTLPQNSQKVGSLLPDNSFTNTDQVTVKQEPSNEEEDELEITGVEMNPTEMTGWGQVNEGNPGAMLSDVNLPMHHGDDIWDEESENSVIVEESRIKRRVDVKPLGVKYRAIMEFEKGQKSKTAVAKMFKIPLNTFSGWLKQADLIKKGICKFGPKRQTMRRMQYSNLEAAVLKWFKDAKQKNRPLNGPIVTEKAGIIAKQLGLTEFRNSTGWLERFKKRNDISFNAIKSCANLKKNSNSQ